MSSNRFKQQNTNSCPFVGHCIHHVMNFTNYTVTKYKVQPSA